MKVLIVGSGGREHALAWKIAQSERVTKIYCAPGNGGTAEICENVPIGFDKIGKLAEYAKENKIDLTIVGPEAPLVAGIVDRFRRGRHVLKPTSEFTVLRCRHVAVDVGLGVDGERSVRQVRRAYDATPVIARRWSYAGPGCCGWIQPGSPWASITAIRMTPVRWI